MSFSVFVKRRRTGGQDGQATSLLALQQEWKSMSEPERAAACADPHAMPAGGATAKPADDQRPVDAANAREAERQKHQQHQQQQQQQHRQDQQQKQGKTPTPTPTSAAPTSAAPSSEGKRTGVQAFLYQQQRQQLLSGNHNLARPCSLQTELEAAKRRKLNAENGRKASSGAAIASIQLPAPNFPGLSRRPSKRPGGAASAPESPFEAQKKRQEMTRLLREQTAARSASISSSTDIDLEAAQASVTGPRLSFDWAYDPIEDIDEDGDAEGDDEGPELTVTLDKDVERSAARSLLRQELSRGISAQQLSNLVGRGVRHVKA